MPDADAELEVELEHARRLAELAHDQKTMWVKKFATYSHILPLRTRSCMKTRRRPGLQKGRDPTGYAT